jgi:hypothetical protein
MEKINVSLTGSLTDDMAYCATFDGYDGAPDAGFQPIGYGATEAEAIADLEEQQADLEAEMWDDEPQGSHDLSDDGDALASAGWGTDEDYGGGDDRY